MEYYVSEILMDIMMQKKSIKIQTLSNSCYEGIITRIDYLGILFMLTKNEHNKHDTYDINDIFYIMYTNIKKFVL